MNYEFDYPNMTKEQLNKRYIWNNRQIQIHTNEISRKNIMHNICFYTDLFLGVLFGYITIFEVLGVHTLSSLLGFGFMILHGYSCTYCLSGMENEIKEIENNIDYFLEENRKIKKFLT